VEGGDRDTLLLDILQRVASLQVTVERLSHDRDKASEMLVTVAQLTQTVARLAPIVESLDLQRNQAIGVMWFGRIFWALIGSGLLTLIGWIAHKFGAN
jgi:hypothetical protein